MMLFDLSKIAAELKKRNFTQADVAEVLGRKQQGGVSMLLNGKRAMTVADLSMLLIFSDIRVSEVLKDEYAYMLQR